MLIPQDIFVEAQARHPMLSLHFAIILHPRDTIGEIRDAIAIRVGQLHTGTLPQSLNTREQRDVYIEQLWQLRKHNRIGPGTFETRLGRFVRLIPHDNIRPEHLEDILHNSILRGNPPAGYQPPQRGPKSPRYVLEHPVYDGHQLTDLNASLNTYDIENRDTITIKVREERRTERAARQAGNSSWAAWRGDGMPVFDWAERYPDEDDDTEDGSTENSGSGDEGQDDDNHDNGSGDEGQDDDNHDNGGGSDGGKDDKDDEEESDPGRLAQTDDSGDEMQVDDSEDDDEEDNGDGDDGGDDGSGGNGGAGNGTVDEDSIMSDFPPDPQPAQPTRRPETTYPARQTTDSPRPYTAAWRIQRRLVRIEAMNVTALNDRQMQPPRFGDERTGDIDERGLSRAFQALTTDAPATAPTASNGESNTNRHQPNHDVGAGSTQINQAQESPEDDDNGEGPSTEQPFAKKPFDWKDLDDLYDDR